MSIDGDYNGNPEELTVHVPELDDKDTQLVFVNSWTRETQGGSCVYGMVDVAIGCGIARTVIEVYSEDAIAIGKALVRHGKRVSALAKKHGGCPL